MEPNDEQTQPKSAAVPEELKQSVVQNDTAEKDGENEENDENEEMVMRTEIVVAIKDTAQPTADEVKEFESFASKY